jgi:hypothetical protein
VVSLFVSGEFGGVLPVAAQGMGKTWKTLDELSADERATLNFRGSVFAFRLAES